MRAMLQLVARAIIGLLVLGALIFLLAWTLDYWRAWVFIAVFAVSTLAPSVYLLMKAPDTLQRRMRAGPKAETRPLQRLVIVLVCILSIGLFVLPPLDYRFGWSSVPPVVSVLGNVLVAAGLLLAMMVVVQNSYAAATVTVESGQQVVSTGLYGLVRHPMYLATLVAMIGVPPALGSWWGLVLVLPMTLALAFRIRDEEALLEGELDGYRDYMRTTRFRMIPYVW